MAEYPALYEVSTREFHSVTTKPGGIEVGRNASADVPLAHLAFSRRQFRVVWANGAYYIENLSQTNITLLNGNGVSSPTALHHGDRIRVADCDFVFLERADVAVERKANSPTQPPVVEAIAPVTAKWPAATMPPPPTVSPAPSWGSSPDSEVTFVGPSSKTSLIDLRRVGGEHQIGSHTLIGRDGRSVNLQLPSMQVSRKHAQVVHTGGRFWLSDLSSANGVYVNGRRVREAVELRSSDRVGIGPFSLLFTGRSLVVSTCEGNASLVANNLTHRVKNPATGKSMVILDDVSLVIAPNEFVVILGPSGSGKSTLMNALSARVPATQGTVYLNREDLYVNFDALKRNLALVPQRDVVHGQLTAEDALYYTAKLRLPPDMSTSEINEEINKTLRILRLEEHRRTPVGSLSGGQVKRVCLANETLANPSLLFLDEVTSGLDEQTDRELMTCFREVADSGKTVVCVSHSLTNVDRYCDLVVCLTRGGKLSFFGAPPEALTFFSVPRLGDVYEAMETKTPDEWKQLYRQSPYYAQYITRRQPTATQISRSTSIHVRTPWRELAQTTVSQTRTLIHRYTATTLADRGAVVVTFGQAIIVAILLWMLFGDLSRWEVRHPAMLIQYTSQLLFLLSTSCIWLGCSNAAKEIVKEQNIYRRERDVNLLVPSYYFSKLGVLGLLGFLQTMILFGIVSVACHLDGDWFPQLVLLILATLSGTVLGLCISAASKTTDVAATIVPLALIPQVVLAGAIAPLEGLAKALAICLIPNYWAFDSLKATLPESWSLRDTGSAVSGAFVLAFFVVVGTAVAILMLRREDRNAGVLWRTLAGKVRTIMLALEAWR